MASDSPPSRAPVTVLTRGGTTARFDGEHLTVARDRSTWTVPVRALDSADLSSDGTIRVTISGPTDAATHGLGPLITLRGPNRSAVEAFFGPLGSAVARTPSAPDGHALIHHHVRPRTARTPMGPAWRRGLTITGLILLHHLLLTAIGLLTLDNPGLAVFAVILFGTPGLLGGLVLWRAGRRFRSLWLLRTRGISVVGTCTGHVFMSKDPHRWVFSTMDFTTVDGRRMTHVPSVVSIRRLSNNPLGPVDLSYDPEHPSRASRPLTTGFVIRTLILAAPGAALSSGYVLLLLAFLTS
ncbi:hypothetical protein ABT354_25465 [Streptomyces sp. NPDC000594]|uniref:hypothetical protein n=1 Tax=Streptomyces sp. NPDC000594 TaxID=3154261 RepID=UPI00331DB7F8